MTNADLVEPTRPTIVIAPTVLAHGRPRRPGDLARWAHRQTLADELRHHQPDRLTVLAPGPDTLAVLERSDRRARVAASRAEAAARLGTAPGSVR